MLNLSDLIGIPYKEHGRDKNGMDCYGLVIEVSKRLGTPLNDIFYDNHDSELADKYAPSLNVSETNIIDIGTILEMEINGELHIGICINSKQFIHSTYNQGVRISRIGCISIKRMYTINGINQSIQSSK